MRHHTFLMIAGVLCAVSLPAQTPTGPAPTGFDVLVNSPSSVRATWMKGTSITAYMVARYRSSNLTTPERQSAWMTSTTTSWDDPGLVGGVTYVYRLAARYSNNTIGVAEKSVPLPVIADAPAPVIRAAQQSPSWVGPDICFDLAPNTVAVTVQRQRDGNSTIEPLTAAPIPTSTLRKCGVSTFLYTDTTVNAQGKYYYSVIGDLSDGRKGTSAWTAYSTTLNAPTNVSVTKRDSYTAVVSFGSPPGASPNGYRIVGTGLPAAGIDASSYVTFNGPGTFVLPNLAAGTYSWWVHAVYKPGLLSGGVPVTISMP